LLLLLSPEWLYPEAYTGEGTAARRRGYTAPPLPELWRSRGGNRILVFSLAEPGPRERRLSFALNLLTVQEVLELPKLVRVPRSPAHVLGLASWRDWAVPVIDLAQRLALPPVAVDKRSRLLLVRAGRPAELVGFVVRPALNILRLPVPHRP